MTRRQKQTLFSVIFSVAMLCADQLIKIAVKTSMYLHQSIHVTDWFQIVFTENRGMAFGMELFDKFFLTSFRIIAVSYLIFFIAKHIRKGIGWGCLVCLNLILAGAAGNIFDCVFYGMIFNNPPAPIVAEFVSWGTGYDKLFLGKVVDMFYFPLVEWDWPTWVPLLHGQHFIFFSPIFNFADACISCGVMAILIFYNRKVVRYDEDG